MYCPRCRIETDTDTFCENCGGATISSSEVAATTTAQARIPFPIQEEIKLEKIKIKVPGFSLKKVISSIVVIVLVVVALIGYKTLQSQYTPMNATKVFYNYIVKEDYDSAYKMLVNTDDQYMSKELFKSYMQQKNIKTFYIKNYNAKDFPQDLNSSNSQNNNIKSSGNMFTVQASGKLYPVDIVENGSKFIFFKDYKIQADNFSVKWQLVAPTGAKILINGKTPDVSNEPNADIGSILNDKYKPTTVLYQIDRIYNGSYDVTSTMDGADDFKLALAPAGKKVTIQFNASADTVKKLQEQVKTYLDLYYSKASNDKYASLLTTDSDILTKTGGFNYSSDKVTNKLQDLKVTKSQLDDIDHATISINGSEYFEDSSLVEWGMAKQTGTKEISTEFYFQRVNGQWLINDTGYIN